MIGLLVLLIVFIIFVIVMLSPLEALSWWAGWFSSDTPEQTYEDLERIIYEQGDVSSPDVEQYVVFMTGIGGFAHGDFLLEERRFLDRLAEAMPEIELVDDVYPYTAIEKGLTEGRISSSFWRYVVRQKNSGKLVGMLVNLRNLMQVLVAADPRYGPIYAWGLTRVVLKALVRHKYPFGSGMPITLVGYSGGGEMSLQVVELLKKVLNAPIRVISLGGVFTSDPNLVYLEHLYHIYGDRDNVQQLGLIFFPGRWPLVRWSAWNRAKAEGRVTMVSVGAFAHNGIGGYMDHETKLNDGRSHLDVSIETVTRLLRETPAHQADSAKLT